MRSLIVLAMVVGGFVVEASATERQRIVARQVVRSERGGFFSGLRNRRRIVRREEFRIVDNRQQFRRQEFNSHCRQNFEILEFRTVPSHRVEAFIQPVENRKAVRVLQFNSGGDHSGCAQMLGY